jgi:hypothetical protein
MILLTGSLLTGAWMTSWQDSWLKWMDNTFTVLGGLSLTLGWAIALIVRAQRMDAALSFRHAGEEGKDLSFDAALICGSNNQELTEWHLYHLKHERVEILWTDYTRRSMQHLLSRYVVQSLHGPGCVAEEPLTDPFDLGAIKRLCELLLKEILARYPAERVCVDVTGGTVLMSIAAFQAAEELGVTSLYLLGTHIPAQGKALIRKDHVHERSEGKVIMLSDHRRNSDSPSIGDEAPAETRDA